MAEEKDAKEKDAKEKAEKTTTEKAKAEEKIKKDTAVKKDATAKKAKNVTASARTDDARVSTKNSVILVKEIRGKKLARAKALMEGLVSEKYSLGKKHYTNAAKKILELLKAAEANAKAKAMDESRLFVISANAAKGNAFFRPRSRMGRRGESAKVTKLDIVLGER